MILPAPGAGLNSADAAPPAGARMPPERMIYVAAILHYTIPVRTEGGADPAGQCWRRIPIAQPVDKTS